VGDGTRNDGTQKGTGFFGVQKMTDGSGRDMTEFSIGVDFGQGETEIPTLVPTLTKKELDFLKAGNDPSKTIIEKATRHAEKRTSEGKSPFIEAGEKITPLDIDVGGELERINVDPEPLSSINGVQMTRTEFGKYRELSDPADLLDGVIKLPSYAKMTDKERRLVLHMTIDQLQDNADNEIMNTGNEFFRPLRQRIRAKEIEGLEPPGGN